MWTGLKETGYDFFFLFEITNRTAKSAYAKENYYTYQEILF